MTKFYHHRIFPFIYQHGFLAEDHISHYYNCEFIENFGKIKQGNKFEELVISFYDKKIVMTNGTNNITQDFKCAATD